MASSDTSNAASESESRSHSSGGDDGQSRWSEWVICWCVTCRGRCQQEYRTALDHETWRGRDPEAPAGSSREPPRGPSDSSSDDDSPPSHQTGRVTRHQQSVHRMQRDIPSDAPSSETAAGIERETRRDFPLPPHLEHHLRTYDRYAFGTWPADTDLPRHGVPFQYWGHSYMIAPSDVEGGGYGLFSVDGITVPRNSYRTLMVFGGPIYTWGQWHVLSSYILSMADYGLCLNSASIRDRQRQGEEVNYGQRLYIDGRPYSQGNIAGFINSSRGDDAETNCIFEERSHVMEDYMPEQVERCVMVVATRTIQPQYELFVNYPFQRRTPARLLRGMH